MGDNIDLYGDFNESDDAAAVGDDDENVPKDGDQEDEGTKVDVNPKVRRTKSTLFVLNDARLMNLERGVSTLEKHYTDIKFQGKGREKADLDNVLKRMEHWANRLYPKYTLDDCLTKIDQLGKKKTVQRHLSQYRMNMLDPIVSQTEETSDKEDNNQEDEPIDEYEDLINQQIALSTVNNTSTSRANNSFNSSAAFDELSASSRTVTIPPKSAPVVPAVEQARLTDELRARIAENKRKAIERFNARQLELAKDQENLVSAPVDDVITSQNIEIEATQEPITQSQENDTSEADTSILSGIHPMADSPQKTQENNTENMEE